jgi:hypothetical protein
MSTPLSLALTSLFAAVAGVAIWPQQGEVAVAEVAAATKEFLGTLPPAQLKKAAVSLTDGERTQWAFVPGLYAGVTFGELNDVSTKAAHKLLHTVLSARGYGKTTAIMQLENVLHEIESAGGKDASHRDPGRYTLLVFGEPAAEGTFALRLQGHHVSLQFACSKGHLVGHTPAFLGTNPHELRGGKDAGKRVLGAEEDLARALLLLCDDKQRLTAIIAAEAPPDVFLGPSKPPSALGARAGLPVRAMGPGQREVLWRLIEEYAHNLRGEFADAELRHLKSEFDGMYFAWAGGTEHGQGHYYRIHGEHFAIEYDNTQNDANHVHTVWRDFEHDFGGDALGEHYAEHRHDAGK